jgi:hypothetical protein
MNESAKKYCENCLSKQIIIHAETINKIIEQCLIEFPSTNTQQLKEYLHQYCQEKHLETPVLTLAKSQVQLMKKLTLP